MGFWVPNRDAAAQGWGGDTVLREFVTRVLVLPLRKGKTHKGRLLGSDSKPALSRTPRPFLFITGMRIVTCTGGGTEALTLNRLP